MIKHLTRHGNSAALIIEKPILELLGISFNTPLKISTNGKKLIISVVTKERHHHAFEKTLDYVMKRNHETFKKLAE